TLEKLIGRVRRRKGDQSVLLGHLEVDLERLQNGASFPAIDRYLPLIYPDLATAADYVPADAVVLFCESSRVAERGKHYLRQLGEDVAALVENGTLAGDVEEFAAPLEERMETLLDWPVVYLDSFTSSSYPQRPKTLLSVLAKQ